MDTFGKRLKTRIDDLGLSFEKVAKSIGVSWQSVQQWCNGKTHPGRKKEQTLADALQCSREWLFYGIEAGDLNPKDIPPSPNMNEAEDKAKSSPYITGWPFASVSFSRYSSLSAKDKRFVEGVFLDAVVRCEDQATEKQQMNASR